MHITRWGARLKTQRARVAHSKCLEGSLSSMRRGMKTKEKQGKLRKTEKTEENGGKLRKTKTKESRGKLRKTEEKEEKMRKTKDTTRVYK